MTLPATLENWWLWGITIAVGFPIIVVILGEMVYRLAEDYPALSHIVRITRLFVIPIAVALIFFQYVMGYDTQHIICRLLATVLWIVVIHVTLLLMDLLLFGSQASNSWRANVPALLRDIGRIFLVMLGVAFVLASIWNVDLAGLLTALGLGSLVIGLALQDTLKNIFSGIALLAENPVRIGDWVQVDDAKGKVVQTNWRAVHLETRQRELLVIPNSELTTKSIKNFSIKPRHIEVVELLFSSYDQPNHVASVLQEVCTGIQELAPSEESKVAVLRHEDRGSRYIVRLVCKDFAQSVPARNEFMTRVWYAAQRYGLLLGGDGEHVSRVRPDNSKYVSDRLVGIAGFAGIDQKGINRLTEGSRLLYFGKGEYILRQGERNNYLYVILNGSATVLLEDNQGGYKEIAQLTRGQLFGEIALMTNRVTLAHVRASEDLEVIAIDIDALQTLLDQVPELARALNRTIDARREAISSR